MLERLANKLTDYLISKGADPENKDIYAYALEYIFSSILSYGILLILAAVLNLVLQMFLFILFWIPVRSNFGGIHAPSQALCLILSAVFGVGSVMLAINFMPSFWAILICLVACIILTFIFAPVIHPNHPVSPVRLVYVKKTVRLIVIVETVVVIILSCLSLNWISSIGLYSIGFAVLFGLLGKLTNKPINENTSDVKKQIS